MLDYCISSSLLFTILSLHFPLNFSSSPARPKWHKAQRDRKSRVWPLFCVTGGFEITCLFYVMGSNSFTYVCVCNFELWKTYIFANIKENTSCPESEVPVLLLHYNCLSLGLSFSFSLSLWWEGTTTWSIMTLLPVLQFDEDVGFT